METAKKWERQALRILINLSSDIPVFTQEELDGKSSSVDHTQ